jgi:hypothetical protein
MEGQSNSSLKVDLLKFCVVVSWCWFLGLRVQSAMNPNQILSSQNNGFNSGLNDPTVTVMQPKGGLEHCFNSRFKTNERTIADFERIRPVCADSHALVRSTFKEEH